MKRTKFFPVLRHAFGMVGRTLKSYALLSVTIILSFSLLLGYLLYTDTSLYNQYKNVFSYRRGDILIRDGSENGKKLQMLLENLSELENTGYYMYYYSIGGVMEVNYAIDSPLYPEDSLVNLPNWQLYYLPDHSWPGDSITTFDTDITWFGEPREDFYLAEDEAILCESVYRALGLDQVDDPVYTFRFEAAPTLTLRIVGYTKEESPLTFYPAATGSSTYLVSNPTCQLILSAKLIDASTIDENELLHLTRYLAVYTDSPEQVAQLAETMDFEDVLSIYKEQNSALEAIRYEKKNKAIISMALLLLLGINLYSSFTNALNDRKFEIGVKRAIGASSWSIVRQFLYESMIVMVANIFISVALVADVFIVYKYIYEHTPNQSGIYSDWIICLSPYSIAMFGICAATLTIVFSLIFAYKSTRVEIVQYLKAE